MGRCANKYTHHDRRIILLLLAGINACSPDSSLQLLSEHQLANIKEPSGLTFAQGRLYAVSDKQDRIFTYSADGILLAEEELQLEAEETDAVSETGFEALDFDGNSFWAAKEENGTIYRIAAAIPHATTTIAMPAAAVDGNAGIEGLFVHQETGNLYAVKQKDPVLLFTLDAQGRERSRLRLDFTEELSGLAYLNSSCFLAVGKSEETFYIVTFSGELAYDVALDKSGYESIAYDGSSKLYAVLEREARLHIYDFHGDDYCAPQ